MRKQKKERRFRDVLSRNERTAKGRTKLAEAIFSNAWKRSLCVACLASSFGVGEALTVVDAARADDAARAAVATRAEIRVAAVETGESTDAAEAAFEYRIDKFGGGATITGVRDRTVKRLVAPARLGGSPVREIAPEAFRGLRNLESFSYGSGVHLRTVGARAFEDCVALKAVAFPPTVAFIQDGTFAGCASLQEFETGDAVCEIGPDAFAGCFALEKVFVGRRVVQIAPGAFAGCGMLSNFVVNEENAAFRVVDGRFLTSKDGKTLYACPGAQGDVVVPEGVVTIAEKAFYNAKNLRSISFPATLRTIGTQAFAGCDNLQRWSGAAELETIGADAFAACERLVEIEAPATLEAIEAGAFRGCVGLKELDLTATKTRRIAQSAFEASGLQSVRLSSETREIGEKAFYGTGVVRFSVPRDLEVLGPQAFGPTLTDVDVEEGNGAFKVDGGALLSADGGIFYTRLDRAAKTFAVPDGVRVVADRAFSNDKTLTELALPEGVVKVGKNALYGCFELRKVSVPTTVREMEFGFVGRVGAATVEIAEGNPNFKVVDGAVLSADGKTLYRAALRDSKQREEDALLGSFGAPNGVERIAAGALGYDALSLPTSVKRIDAGAFDRCRRDASIEIPASVERLDERFLQSTAYRSFKVDENNPNYRSVDGALLSKDGKTFYRLVAPPRTDGSDGTYVVPAGVETIESDAFLYLSGVTKIVLPKSLRKIESHAFKDANTLESVWIPAGVETVEPNAFYRCDSLREIVVENKDTTLSSRAFAGLRQKVAVVVDPEVERAEIAKQKAAEEKKAAELALAASFEWTTLQDGGAAILGVRDKSATAIEIPKTLRGAPVRSIYPRAFAGMTNLKSVRIASSVVAINYNAFAGCANLEKVEFASRSEDDGVGFLDIYDGAFAGCSSLKTFEAPDWLNQIGARAFAGCSSLEKVKLGKNTGIIMAFAFADCAALRDVDVSANEKLAVVGFSAFAGCDALEKFVAPKTLANISPKAFGERRSKRIEAVVDAENPNFKVEGDFLLSKDGKTVCAYLGALEGEVVVPEGVETLGESPRAGSYAPIVYGGASHTAASMASQSVFAGVPIERVRLPKSLRVIGQRAFYGCETLKSVEIPEDSALAVVDAEAFSRCLALESFACPKSLRTIGNRAFASAESLKSFTGASSLEKIGEWAFVDCKALETIELPNGLREIGQSAFAETALTSVKIPASVQVVGEAAFAITPLKTIEVEEGNEALKVVDGALLSKDGKSFFRLPPALELKAFKIPDGVEIVERAALGGNATLESVELPPTVVKIESNAFYRNSSLKKIAIPASVLELADRFQLCDSLEVFEVDPNNPVYKSVDGALLSKDGKTFYRIVAVERDPNGEPIVLEPQGNDEERREIPAYKTRVFRVPDGVETIAANAFTDTRRTRNAFTEIVLPEGLKTIDSNAFYCCYELETLRIPASVSHLGHTSAPPTSEPGVALLGAVNLKTFEVALGNALYRSQDGMLLSADGKSLYGVVADRGRSVWKIPEGVVSFSRLLTPKQAKEIVFPEGLERIHSGTFYDYPNLTKVTIPKSVSVVPPGAFQRCPQLAEVVLKSSLTRYDRSEYVLPTVPKESVAQLFDNYDGKSFVDCAPNLTVRVEEETAPGVSVRINPADVMTYEEAATVFEFRVDSVPGRVSGEITIVAIRDVGALDVKIPAKIDDHYVVKIAEGAFKKSEARTLTLPSTLRVIESGAFTGAKLEKILALPGSLETFSGEAFVGCSALRSVELDSKNERLKNVGGVLLTADGKTLCYYPRGLSAAGYQVPDGVETIAKFAFAGNQYLKEIQFPWTLKRVEEKAFSACRSLTSARFYPVVNQLERLEEGAFAYCDALKSIELPDGLAYVGKRAFYCESLESVGFYPVSAEAKPGMTVATQAFCAPNLKSFEIPETMKKFEKSAVCFGTWDGDGRTISSAYKEGGDLKVVMSANVVGELATGAFYGSNLGAIELDPANPRYKSVDGALLSADGKTLYCYPTTKTDEEFVVPDGVERIGERACFGAKFRKVRTPNSLRYVEGDAFRGCQALEELEIAEGVVEIAATALQCCSNLTTLRLPSTLTDDALFAKSHLARWTQRLTTLEVAPGCDALQKVDGAVLSKDGKTLYFFPRGERKEFVIPDGVEKIADFAFAGARVESVKFPAGLKQIGNNAFSGAETELLQVGATERLGTTYRFGEGAALTALELPEGLEHIGYNAFGNCRSLVSAKIPASVNMLGYGAFSGCSSLKAIEVAEGNKNWQSVDGVLFSADGRTLCAYPCGREATEYVVPSNVDRVLQSAFRGAKNLTKVTMRRSLVYYGVQFDDCRDDLEIEEPNSSPAPKIGEM